MVSRKTYILVILALLNACAPTVTVNPPGTPSVTPGGIMNSDAPVNSVSNPTPIPTASSVKKLLTLSATEVKQITDSNIVKADNAFGIKLFLDIVKEQKNENTFISPASVALALQMLYNGAEDQTKDEMTKTLELGDLSLDGLNNLNKLLIQKLETPSSDITLQVANSIWSDKNIYSFKDEYKKNLTEYYKADSTALDFRDPKSVDIINSWISDNTNGKIPKVLQEIPLYTVAYLINAIYFKANWTERFETSQTQDGQFTLAGNTKKTVKMMSDFRTFKYFSKNISNYGEETDSTLGFQGAELTYGDEGKVSLIIFLPDAKSSLEKFYSQLNEENLEKWLNGFYNYQGYISFPKFKNEWKKELKGNLQELGIKRAFSDQEPSAQLQKMGILISPLGNVYIDKVLHNTFVDVNEEGTEAAAVTVIAGSTTPSSAPSARFVADRPFFYMIRDNDTKSILFMGAVNDPKYEN